MKGQKDFTKSPIKALAVWLALVFVCCTIMPLIYFVPRKAGVKNPDAATQIEYVGKTLSDPVLAAPLEELEAEEAIVTEKITNATSIATAFAEDFDSYIVKVISTDADGNTTETITGVNSLNSPTDVTGSGTETNPYVVKTLRGWLWVANLIQYGTGTYTYINLGADIDFDGYIYDFIGQMSCGFVGVIDGCGYALKNLICSSVMFSGIGGFMSETSETGFELITEYSNIIKNLNMQAILNGSGMAGLFGMITCNLSILNCDFDLYSYGNDMGVLTGLYNFGDYQMNNCQLNLRSRSGMCYVNGMFVGGELLGYSSVPSNATISNCRFDANIITTTNPYYGIVAWGTYYGGVLTISNCKAYGYFSTACYSTLAGMGVFIGQFMGSDNVEDSLITNCENYVIMAAPRPMGPFACSVSMSDGQSGENISKLQIKNCTNYGDVYWTYDDNTTTPKPQSGMISGFVATVSYYGELLIDNCTNYGDLYGGMFMAGFLGCNVSIATIKNSSNFGSINYHCIANVWPTASAGIAAMACDDSRQKSIYIENCSFVGDVTNKECNLAYNSSSDNDGYMTYFSGICGIGLTSLSQNVCIKDIIIKDCYVDINVKSTTNAQITPIFIAMTVAKYMDNSTLLIDNNMAFITTQGYFCGLGIGTDWFHMNGIYPTLMTISNNYYEFNIMSSVNDVTIGAGIDIASAVNMWNNQYNIFINYDSDIPFAENVTNTSYRIYFYQFQYATDAATLSRENESYSISVNVSESFTQSISISKSGLVESNPCKNVVVDYTSNIEGDENIKQYYHTDDSVEKFPADKWFYSPQQNGGRPMLRQFFHLAKYYTNQDCAAQFEALGYTQYVAESTT